MKILKSVTLFVFSMLILACSGYGEKLNYKGTDIYYTDKVEKAEAEKLGEFLVRQEFADGVEKSVQLTKNDSTNNYVFRMVTAEEFINKEGYDAIFKTFSKQISDSVFNSQPLDFHLCNDTFKTVKEFNFENGTKN